ncbi:MAG: nickel pincer cofactor biosynthesis protein LarB [Gemmatimonadota bacterium]|nr:nickel pincer cofactor biosynthesis protein LarB [Gemmatimonadota bacterium]MDH5198599.1 nickel pincer cofactor biosynthesis protein LarB [Gemmatimonadota bacterium]
MTSAQVRELLERVAAGALTPAAALEALARFPVEELGYATVDHARGLTQGHQEVVFCEGKTPEQVEGICVALAESSGMFLATRAIADVRTRLLARFSGAEENSLARTVRLVNGADPEPTGRGTVMIATAGTSDLPVAEEAAVVARTLGNRVARLTDVGVAGIHRLLRHSDELRDASVVIVAAGMDGALASVVGGMVKVPVIAVPTSVGYGSAFGGLSALLAMLNSCASGVTVVNIDNGFGAAVAASRINHLA